MMLVPFLPQDYPQLTEWIDSAKLNYLWGGPAFAYPLTKEQIANHVTQPQVSAFLFKDGLETIGYIELFAQSTTTARVCRVFVAKNHRGKGAAQSMMQALFEISRARGYTQLNLCVFANNHSALNCYQLLGFTENNRELGSRQFEGEEWELIYMSKAL